MEAEATQSTETAADHFKVKTEHFEGPLDLLLDLIEKRKLFINDFSLAKVTDDYIAHIRRFEQFPVSDVANFILVASTLVLIKSKSILPTLDLTREEESDIDDLKRRLILYEMFRDLSQHIKARFGKQMIYESLATPEVVPVYAPDARLSVGLMHEAITSVLTALPKKTHLPQVAVKKVISIEEVMESLAGRVKHQLKMRFGQFTKYEKGMALPKEDRVMVIVGFLAMLELVKQGILHVTQHEHHGDIDIETHEFTTPQYS
ncbi:MAG TPA: ScpA family protein [Candidatus Paceibacterota bacterium]|nr:ScpA family protein [Candidatus Paceibacterota bacterium]